MKQEEGTLKVIEIYESVQGEGPNTGRPTLFVRFAGCNMRCPGWPCDTEYAVDPALWHKAYTSWTVANLAARINEEHSNMHNVCFTGGEPFMQKELPALINRIRFSSNIEVFSNGSFPMERIFLRPAGPSNIMMDWKLTGSGEATTAVPTRTKNALDLLTSDGIKFVVKDMDDLREAKRISAELKALGVKAQFWVGAAWGTISNQEIVDFVLKSNLNWNLNVQIHKYIWEPTTRGI